MIGKLSSLLGENISNAAVMKEDEYRV